MKPSDLMIGDWVNIVPEEERDKMFQVQVDRIIRHNYNRLTIGKGELHTHHDLITPIPLTEEILKANGFEYRGFTAYESMHYDHSVTVYFNKDREIFMLIGGEQRWMRYVHELQHALRLCGLNELADNFKVK